MKEALDIRVRGVVQGVGFRPFVYRLAKHYLISGYVLNDTEGVFIHAEGDEKLVDQFVMDVADKAPAAARVTNVKMKEVPLTDAQGFEIRYSNEEDTDEVTLVSPDLATCDDCLRELFDPVDRRYRYPFINCTNCGPRFTIIDKLPYDRAHTSMKDFTMCSACAREYADPADRRFHAQPDACFACGPHVSWHEGESCRDVEPSDATRALVSEMVAADDGVVWGTTRETSDAVFARAVELLRAGKIVAVKGLGGFHLVCDAENPEALSQLRLRKLRDGKAFAVMMPSAEAARRVCHVDAAEASQLERPARPIVLLRKRADAQLAAGLADKLPELGVMLPTTPVQHLLMHDYAEACARDPRAGCAGDMLVMTSGNMHDEPIEIDDADAFARLAQVADAFLGNDRAILARYDDSVVRVINVGVDAKGAPNEAVQVIRRARGFAPAPLSIAQVDGAAGGEGAAGAATGADAADAADGAAGASGGAAGASATSASSASTQADDAAGAAGASAAAAGATAPASPQVFACGPEQKNTFTFVRGDDAFVSQHIGDLEDADVYDAWLDAKARFGKLFAFEPALVACDRHPEYLSTKWAREQEKSGHPLPVVPVQHHHAHIASVLGEQGLFGPVCGIAFDGTGYGMDGTIWGGEVLLANRQDFERFANFSYVPMPGGAAAIAHPLRMAYGALWEFDLLDHPGARGVLEDLGVEADICQQMIDRGLNTPLTSSVGRLFDAAAAILGVCTEPTYEGEAAILLDAVRSDGERTSAFEPLASLAEDETDVRKRYAVAVTKNTATKDSTAHDTSVVVFDAAPTFKAMLDDREAGVAVPEISRRFHDAIVGAVQNAAELVRAVYGITTVVLSGGVFMNRYVVEQSAQRLQAAGFTVALNRELPPNDGCISYGQAVVARATR
ncbi:MAG: carbamoyltransferase HypF [Eggerthellaceae bacterium]|jgi:hydrogenase maturation protein HypF